MKVNDKVSWIETYRTTGNVIAQRLEWGSILAIVDKPGDRDGFAIKGTYVQVMPIAGGGSIFVFADHVTSVVKS